MSAELALLDLETPEEQEPLVSYAYSYPHKSSYGPLRPPVRIADAWRGEDHSRVALYVHIPFCEMRCGFCNLFTQSRPHTENIDAYLNVLGRQLRVVREQVPDAQIASFAMGGGTPTILSAQQLANLLQAVESRFGFRISSAPTSIETSPATSTADRLQVLNGFGVERISLGVQSFDNEEARALGRPQSLDDLHRTVETIRSCGFPVLNLDLIYGHPSQTPSTWMSSLRTALRYEPEELYLYPLYIRPETGLSRQVSDIPAHRIDLYRAARDLLCEAGYQQMSLRCFQRPAARQAETFSCARDGTIGLGAGARSYTRSLHYATRFAVSQAGIRVILNDWLDQTDEQLGVATHGIQLTADEQRRRFLILNLLQRAGLDLQEYALRFRSNPLLDFPELDAICDGPWLVERSGCLVLTERGVENSDVIGPMLYSEAVRTRLREFVRR
jgi:oxygen-independent coproporphyrinogen-3 oxidase